MIFHHALVIDVFETLKVRTDIKTSLNFSISTINTHLFLCYHYSHQFPFLWTAHLCLLFRQESLKFSF